MPEQETDFDADEAVQWAFLRLCESNERISLATFDLYRLMLEVIVEAKLIGRPMTPSQQDRLIAIFLEVATRP